MEIYTSYFGRQAQLKQAGIIPIGIALWPPKWFQGLHYQVIAPRRYMMGGKATREQYIEMYFNDVVGKLSPERVLADLERMSGGQDVALLCYEKPGEFCHRRLFAQWMLEQTGLEIPEWEPGGGQKKAEMKQPEPVKPIEEPSLFGDLF